MNSFSRLSVFLFLAAFLAATEARALEVGAFYFASCQRHLGVILGVDNQNIQIATVEGEVVTLPRYQIIYWSSYPVEDLPLSLSPSIQKVPRQKIYTRQDYHRVLLAEGWPIDFTEDRISFLTPEGVKQVIEIDSIWEIERTETEFTVPPIGVGGLRSITFAHPPAFRDCPNPGEGKKVVYSEQTLTDPVSIKRELDRLQQGHSRLAKFESRQRFYAVPQIYKNRTYLGLWHMLGSRYGSSARRANNFTPFLVDQTSKEPFGFQQDISTGAAPLAQLVHEETQVNFYYRFKADYFHFSGMLDPMLAFIGEKYKWIATDLASGDDRLTEQYFAEVGFDVGHLSLEVYPAAGMETSAKVGGTFVRRDFSIPQGGLSFQNQRAKVEVLAGGGQQSGFKLWVERLNLNWEFDPRLDASVSLISRKFDVDARNTFSNPGGSMIYSSSSFTAAGYLNYVFSRKYYTSAFLSREGVSRSFGVSALDHASSDAYWKGGMSFALGF